MSVQGFKLSCSHLQVLPMLTSLTSGPLSVLSTRLQGSHGCKKRAFEAESTRVGATPLRHLLSWPHQHVGQHRHLVQAWPTSLPTQLLLVWPLLIETWLHQHVCYMPCVGTPITPLHSDCGHVGYYGIISDKLLSGSNPSEFAWPYQHVASLSKSQAHVFSVSCLVEAWPHQHFCYKGSALAPCSSIGLCQAHVGYYGISYFAEIQGTYMEVHVGHLSVRTPSQACLRALVEAWPYQHVSYLSFSAAWFLLMPSLKWLVGYHGILTKPPRHAWTHTHRQQAGGKSKRRGHFRFKIHFRIKNI